MRACLCGSDKRMWSLLGAGGGKGLAGVDGGVGDVTSRNHNCVHVKEFGELCACWPRPQACTNTQAAPSGVY